MDKGIQGISRFRIWIFPNSIGVISGHAIKSIPEPIHPRGATFQIELGAAESLPRIPLPHFSLAAKTTAPEHRPGAVAMHPPPAGQS
jgi:hypothetical protein